MTRSPTPRARPISRQFSTDIQFRIGLDQVSNGGEELRLSSARSAEREITRLARHGSDFQSLAPELRL
jgi:hypothetical protein